MNRFVLLLMVIMIGVGIAYGSKIKGIVKNSDTGDPLIGANVMLDRKSVGYRKE